MRQQRGAICKLFGGRTRESLGVDKFECGCSAGPLLKQVSVAVGKGNCACRCTTFAQHSRSAQVKSPTMKLVCAISVGHLCTLSCFTNTCKDAGNWDPNYTTRVELLMLCIFQQCWAHQYPVMTALNACLVYGGPFHGVRTAAQRNLSLLLAPIAFSGTSLVLHLGMLQWGGSLH